MSKNSHWLSFDWQIINFVHAMSHVAIWPFFSPTKVCNQFQLIIPYMLNLLEIGCNTVKIYVVKSLFLPQYYWFFSTFRGKFYKVNSKGTLSCLQFLQVCLYSIRVLKYHWIVTNYEILFYERGGNLEQSLCHLLLKLSSVFWYHQTICHSLWGRIRKWGLIFRKNHPILDRLLFEPISILCEFLLEWNTRSSDVQHNFQYNQSINR